jgi:hypothetical protein
LLFGDVDYVVFGACWYDYGVSVFDEMFFAVDDYFSFSFFKPEELVEVAMCFFSDLLLWL